MKLGVISDTHDNLVNLQAALELFAQEQVDLVVHCGDWKSPATLAVCVRLASELSLRVCGVLGNNDGDVAGMQAVAEQSVRVTAVEGVLTLALDDRNIAVYHGHHKPIVRRLMEDPDNHIVLLGHTHKPTIQNKNDQLVVNPGSTAFAIPRSKTWRPSVALVDTEQLTAEIRFLV